MQLATTHQPEPRKSVRPPSDYAVQVWTMVARRGMTLTSTARKMHTTPWRVERILMGVSRRNAQRW